MKFVFRITLGINESFKELLKKVKQNKGCN